jgi:saccharopine dehydrogenase (NAD+, L-lysine forming)
MKWAIIREDKRPIDKRVPINPTQARWLMQHYTQIELVCQKSDIRCFSDEAYAAEGVKLQNQVDDCSLLFGVKEVPIDKLIPNATYFFFSHTIKKQAYNRDLLRAILKNKITLVDYECLTDERGNRLIAFGRYAGIVGAYNGIWTYGKRTGLFDLRRARDCYDLNDLRTEFLKVKLPPLKLLITGGGRVASGAMEVLNGIGIKKVSPADFLEHSYSYPVYTQLNSEDYNKPIDGGEFNLQHFYRNPELYKGDFLKYCAHTDVLIAAAYWDPKAPVLFTLNDMKRPDFKIKVIADVTCDIDGSIPSTLKPSTIEEPVYDFDPESGQIAGAFSADSHINVMAIDNLPCELPRDASTDFGEMLLKNIIPDILLDEKGEIVNRATIAKNGVLTPKFSYLQDYVDGK